MGASCAPEDRGAIAVGQQRALCLQEGV